MRNGIRWRSLHRARRPRGRGPVRARGTRERSCRRVPGELRVRRCGPGARAGAGGRGRAAARHAHVYAHDLEVPARLARCLRLTPVDRPAERAPAGLPRASAGHPDRLEARRRAPASRARCWPGSCCPAAASPSTDGEVVAAILVATIAEAPPPFGGRGSARSSASRAAPGGRCCSERCSGRRRSLAPRGHRGQSRRAASTSARLPPHPHEAYSVDL